ncbi:MAG: rhamnulokinase [Waltera sp.]
MGKYYLAVDIGASSGRHILGHLENGKIKLEEIYRFENGMDHKDGKLLWNVDRLFGEILNGMKKCKELGKIPVSMAIDTWAVDYVLLDAQDRIMGETYGYRDHRTDGMDAETAKILQETELYAKTGIQKQIFNTIYQLMAVKQKEPELLQRAKTLLMLPDYFGFRLTGNKLSEYTNGSTTQLVNPNTFQWDTDLIRKLGYPEDIFLPLKMPGTKVGQLLPEIQKEVGFNLEVVLCGSHDTASAVMAVPQTSGDGIYISSGTWSLMGIESLKPIINEEAAAANFTNEGGYDHRFRFLKNIMGLWMIQSVRHEYKDAYSFAQLCDMAEESKNFPSRVDVNDPSFLSPDNMVEAIKKYCQKTDTGTGVRGRACSVVYRSLAQSYGETVSSLEKIAGRTYDSIHIIGGGSNAAYLNQLTADATGKPYIGPGEATAIGNLLAQMIYAEELTDLKSARQCVRDSFEIKTFVPAK